MNDFFIIINGVNYTDYAIYPLKWGNLLDERLDEAYVTLKFVPKTLQDGAFRPLSLVKLTIYCEPDTYQTELQPETDGVEQQLLENNRLRQFTEKRFLVAKDTVYNNPIGGEFDTHELYIIEETKFLEAFICDTLTFRNALLNRFGAYYPAVVSVDEDKSTVAFTACANNGSLDYYTNPVLTSDQLLVKSLVTVCAPICEYHNTHSQPPVTDSQVIAASDRPGALFPQSKIDIEYSDGRATQTITDINATALITPSAVTTITYTVLIGAEFEHPVSPTDPGVPNIVLSGRFTYTLNGVTNRKPLKKWTITDVVTRCCELAEPLFGKELPRFTLDGVSYDSNAKVQAYAANSQAAKYDKVIAPEFSMTKSTLREQLQQVGGFIHAEPRLVDGKIYFDRYGGTEMSRISQKQFISETQTQSIDEFCTDLDSTADNLVNRLNYAQGVVIEPYADGSRSLRTEQINIRIDESNGIIQTVLPISDVEKLECSVIVDGSTYSDFRDITSFVYEDDDYNNLSSYDVNVNGSKAYALYWTRDSKNINGLFFKNENAINPVFSNYAIYNIMLACGVKMDTGTNKESNYPKLRFRISYIPTYTARVRTNKSLVIGGLPRTLAYNQGANSVETQYYGENLKGVVARLGNVEKTLTYKLTWLTDIPKAGQLFDEHNYISAVSVEMYATYFKVTIGLSRDFNRLSQYIGISSEYRQYQVSERAVYNRESVIQEYALITYKNNVYSDLKPIFATEKLLKLFTPSDGSADMLTCATVKTYYGAGNTQVNLPLISSSFGNTISLRFAFADNYSAGQKSVRVEKDGNVVYYSEYVPYTDYYGKVATLDFWLQPELVNPVATIAFDLPESSGAVYNAAMSTANRGKLRYRKDNAEIPAVNYQLSFVTDDDTIIIGSEIARNCSFVNSSPNRTFYLYLFNKRLPLFDETVDVTDNSPLSGVTVKLAVKQSDDNKWCEFVDAAGNALSVDITSAFESWAIVTGSDEVSEEVSDENGNTMTQTVQNGYRLIIGQNKHYSANDTLTFPRFVIKCKIYD